ncbi:hypothetical protein IEQ34_016654 [Dendrobium chrysotoxum]|uniref:Uncharacterized protein n=1 Tax=Dendrobium chrysotoxum TaxID=161865 RepID=A0AAV7GG74_DENCH|nr:hypothetical protein IEQ34_016654 [Dendrobium chrysotoxum]
MSNVQERRELNEKAGATAMPGGMGGKSLDAQDQNLAEELKTYQKKLLSGPGLGRSRGGQTRKENIGTEGYKEKGRKGGLGKAEETGGERATGTGINID